MLKYMIEALIFASAKGISYEEIKYAFSDEHTEREMKKSIAELQEEYSGTDGKGIVLIEFNQKYQFQNNPVYGEKLAEVLRPVKEKELSSTLLQTLAIIAYKQPVTRAEIEEVRGGVSCDYAVSTLLKLGLIDIVGRKNTVGQPAMFGSTERFLKRFRLKKITDLPSYEELLQAAKDSDKYNKKSENLYRMDGTEFAEEDEAYLDFEEEVAAEVFFDEEDADAIPDFLKDEDIVEIE